MPSGFYRRMSAETRFWFKVEKPTKPLYGKCWLWTGAVSPFGYGKLFIEGKYVSAHKFAYKLYFGYIAEGMCVLHKCDNPRCVNPKHLFLGTHKDNTLDMLKKKRHGGLKFDSDTIKRVIQLWTETDLTQAQIGANLGMDQTYVSKIINKKARNLY